MTRRGEPGEGRSSPSSTERGSEKEREEEHGPSPPHLSLLLTMTPPPSEWFLFSAMAATAPSQRRARSAPARRRGRLGGRCARCTLGLAVPGLVVPGHAGSCSSLSAAIFFGGGGERGRWLFGGCSLPRTASLSFTQSCLPPLRSSAASPAINISINSLSYSQLLRPY